MAVETVRPTKKQRELLQFIGDFITEYGYSPSYREIMAGLKYTSVATVALHVNNLIRRGHLQKRDRSARSLELVEQPIAASQTINTRQLKSSEAKWLVEKVEVFFREVESLARLEEKHLDQLYVLVGSLKVLGLEGAATSFISRLAALKKRLTEGQYIT